MFRMWWKEDKMKIKEPMSDWQEKLILSGFMILVFLPVRILFYTYISKYWLGSFGMITVISLIMIYLTNRNKLGLIGRIWKKQIQKIAKGKTGILLLISPIMLIIFYTGMNYYIENGKQYVVSYNGILGNTLDSKLVQSGLDPNHFGPRTMIRIFQLDFDLLKDPVKLNESLKILNSNFNYFISISCNYTNKWTNGYMQHFSIIFLVESSEEIGLISYFRWFYKPHA